MSNPRSEPLSQQEERELHERLLANDAVAPSDLALAYLDPLTDWLAEHNPRVDPDDCTTAVEDAILALIKNPASYKPEMQSLEVYLRMSSQGDLRNLLRSERRHSKRRADWEAAELSPAMGKYLWDEKTDPAVIVERQEDESKVPASPPIPDSVRARLTSQEEKVLELMQREERRTAVFAAALGITHLPMADQRREVKRVKDRLKKRVERAGDGDG